MAIRPMNPETDVYMPFRIGDKVTQAEWRGVVTEVNYHSGPSYGWIIVTVDFGDVVRKVNITLGPKALRKDDKDEEGSEVVP